MGGGPAVNIEKLLLSAAGAAAGSAMQGQPRDGVLKFAIDQ